MYSVIIVDDEKIIREGISKSLPWLKWGFIVTATADNGKTAFDLVI